MLCIQQGIVTDPLAYKSELRFMKLRALKNNTLVLVTDCLRYCRLAYRK